MSPLCMLGMCGWRAGSLLVSTAHERSPSQTDAYPNLNPILMLLELLASSTHLLPRVTSVENTAGHRCCPLLQIQCAPFNCGNKHGSAHSLPRQDLCDAGAGWGSESSSSQECHRDSLLVAQVEMFLNHKCFSYCCTPLVDFQSIKMVYCLSLYLLFGEKIF